MILHIPSYDRDWCTMVAVGASWKCPRPEPLEGCPFIELRQMPMQERLDYIEKLSDEELKKIAIFHYQCPLDK
jgi:hypothetical protein